MKDQRVYVAHILRCIDRIKEYTQGGEADFTASSIVQDAVLRNLQTLAESAKRLDPHLRSTRAEVDWRALIGFRNVLVHDYLGIDLGLVFRAVSRELPRLEEACLALMKELGEPK